MNEKLIEELRDVQSSLFLLQGKMGKENVDFDDEYYYNCMFYFEEAIDYIQGIIDHLEL